MRRILILIIFVFFSTSVFSYDIKAPKKEYLGTLPVGRDDKSLGLGTPDPNDLFSPNSILILDNGNLVVSDSANRKIKLFSKELKFLGMIPVISERISSDGRLLAGWNRTGEGFIAEIVGQSFGGYSRVALWRPESTSFLFIDGDSIFSVDTDLLVWRYNNKSINQVKSEDWLKEKKDSYSQVGQARLINRSWGLLESNFGLFAKDNGKPYRQPAPADGIDDIYDYNNGELIGIDGKGNHFFVVSQDRILVTNSRADILTSIKYKEGIDDKTYYSYPAVSRSGDIYLLESSRAGHKLLRIAASW